MQTYNVIGLMSGTSLDGLDIAYVRFEKDDTWSFELLASRCVHYDAAWQSQLREAINKSPEEIDTISIELAHLFAEHVQAFIAEEKIEKIDFVSSHGHTIFHQPQKGITLQIGDGPTLANDLQLPVVYDFRSQDVKLGGQGAPLVPIGDRLLFEAYDFCVNIGGIANVSFEHNQQRVAYDVCAANILLNHYALQLGAAYDKDAVFSKQGTVNNELLQALQAIPYHHQAFPKSLGMEYILEHFFPCIDAFQLSAETVLRTCIEYMALEIAAHCSAWGNTVVDVLLTGGGAHHPLLVERLRTLTKAEIIVPNDTIIDFKEAIVFAFLGVLRQRNEVNCLCSVTGAERDHSSGQIAVPTIVA